MALNLATFRTRTLTAAVFVVIMLTGLLWNHWSFFILFSVIHFGCWVEYQKLIGLIDERYSSIHFFHRYGIMIVGWSLMLYFTNSAFILFGIQLHDIGVWMGLVSGFTLLVVGRWVRISRKIQLKEIGYSVAGLVYISLPLGLVMNLRCLGLDELFGRRFDFGWIIPVIIIASIWVNDTMAYIVGSLIGKTPFSKISPKKTWEGTMGGMILAVLFIGFVVAPLIIRKYADGSTTHPAHWFIIAAIASIAGTGGDLFESKLKRLANVKDSGHIMPGHGGFLDRFDSLLFAIPFVWLYVHFALSF